MVDRESLAKRLELLTELLGSLEEVRAEGLASYLSDKRTRASTERWLQLAQQSCIDIGMHLVNEFNLPTPDDYAGVFAALGRSGHLDRDLAGRLQHAARQRNRLVHVYLDLDDRDVFASLEHLGDLRDFARSVQRLVEAP